MTKSYFGFVYLWRDRFWKMSYVGSHMGSLNDSYKCSSARMLRAMKKRPHDFRRKILWILTTDDRKLLLAEEERWLQMIKPHHLAIRYYNLKRRGTGGYTTEGYTEEQRQTYIEKLTKVRRTTPHYKSRACHCAGQEYPTIAEAKRALGWDPLRRLNSRKHIDFYYLDEGQPSTEEVELNRTASLINKRRCVDAMCSKTSSMPVSWHKERTRKSGQTRRGQTWHKHVKDRIGRRVSIDGVVYNNLRQAQTEVKLSAPTIRKRCRSASWPTYQFV